MKALLIGAIVAVVIGVILLIIGIILDFVAYRQLGEGAESGNRSNIASGILKILGIIAVVVAVVLYFMNSRQGVKGKLKDILD